jgi:hypothetical protein
MTRNRGGPVRLEVAVEAQSNRTLMRLPRLIRADRGLIHEAKMPFKRQITAPVLIRRSFLD